MILHIPQIVNYKHYLFKHGYFSYPWSISFDKRHYYSNFTCIYTEKINEYGIFLTGTNQVAERLSF